MTERHLALRIKDGCLDLRDRRPVGTLPQPLADAATDLYRIQQISRCGLKDSDGLDQVRFSRTIGPD
jgi:hypothetical protein